jgi:ceramide glucosyltransferase
MNTWFLIGIVSACGYMTILLTKAWLSARYAIRHPETDILEGSVTVLQPILGGDPFLAESLRSNLQNVSDDTQFDWLLDEIDVNGRQVAEPLAQADPGRIRMIVCPPCPDGINPKLFKLNLALSGVTTEYVAVLDDDTMLSPQHLPKAMAALSDCDVYTGLPRYSVGDNLWSSLVAHFVNNNSILTYLSLLESTGPLTINGMFYVMRTDTLRSYGGFELILAQLCDDYALARLVQSRGGRIRQGVTSQAIQTSITGPRHYLRQMHRWFVFANVLVLDQAVRVRCLLAILLGLPSVLLWGSLLCLAGGWTGAVVLLLFLGLRHTILRMLHYGVFPEPPRFSWLMSIIAELLQLVHLIHACVSPVITWRSRRIHVGRHGSFTQLREANP